MPKSQNTTNQDKRIGIFIDGSNLWHCQKRNGWKVDFKKLKNYFDKRGKIKGIYYFTPEIAHLKNFLITLDKLGYTIIQKPLKKIRLTREARLKTIKKFKTKGNLDMEMGLMMIANMNAYDEYIIITGDSDFEIIVKTLRNKGKNVIIVSNKDSLSREIRKASNFVVYLHKIKKEIKLKNPPKRALS